jgi:hypothetical protein
LNLKLSLREVWKKFGGFIEAAITSDSNCCASSRR